MILGKQEALERFSRDRRLFAGLGQPRPGSYILLRSFAQAKHVGAQTVERLMFDLMRPCPPGCHSLPGPFDSPLTQKQKDGLCRPFVFDPWGNRTPVSAVRGRCLSRLTNGPCRTFRRPSMKHNTTKKPTCQYQNFKISSSFVFRPRPPPGRYKKRRAEDNKTVTDQREEKMRAHYFIERFVRQLFGGMAAGVAAGAVIVICAAVVYRVLT